MYRSGVAGLFCNVTQQRFNKDARLVSTTRGYRGRASTSLSDAPIFPDDRRIHQAEVTRSSGAPHNLWGLVGAMVRARSAGLVDSSRMRIAFELALDAHAEQVGKGTEIAYISHSMGVASLVMEDGGSDDEVAAALLHDAVEDGGEEYVTLIRDALGDHVVNVVLECSDSVVPSGTEKAPWKARKDAYLAGIPGKSLEAIRVNYGRQTAQRSRDCRRPERDRSQGLRAVQGRPSGHAGTTTRSLKRSCLIQPHGHGSPMNSVRWSGCGRLPSIKVSNSPARSVSVSAMTHLAMPFRRPPRQHPRQPENSSSPNRPSRREPA